MSHPLLVFSNVNLLDIADMFSVAAENLGPLFQRNGALGYIQIGSACVGRLDMMNL